MQEVKTSLLSDRVLKMEESATLQMAQLAREYAAKGKEVISLSLGEPDFDTPDHIKEAAKAALDAGYTKYTPVNGLMEFRKAIVEKFARDNDLHFNVGQIVVSNGAKQSISNVCNALLNPGDEVIIFAPYWVSYDAIVRVADGVPVILKAGIDRDFKVTAKQVADAITDRTKIVLFSSPCNPTGSVYTKEELKEIVDVLAHHEDIMIVADEIYEYINFTDRHVSIGTFEAVKDRTITVNGMSKGFAMTGWRLGYIGAPEWVAQACTKIQGQVTSGATSFGQKAAAVALTSDMGPTHMMKEAFLKRRDLMIRGLKNIPLFKVNHPTGAFYIFPDVSAYFGMSYDGEVIANADDFAMFLLKEACVATVSGSAFGADECIRLSYAASEDQLNRAIAQITEAVGKLS